MIVFVVDNDDTWVELVALDLRLEGHEIAGTAADSEQALAAVEALADLDVVVTDYRMPPGPDGIELVEALHRRRPEVRSIVFTNYDDRTLSGRAAAVGAVVVAKPDLRALRAAISRPEPAAT